MGLDNGVVIKFKNKELLSKAREKFEEDLFSKDDECDIFYWRKCWNVRDALIETISNNGFKFEDELYQYFDYNTLVAICDALEKLYTPKGWNTDNTIWSYYDEGTICDSCKDIIVQKLSGTEYEGALKVFEAIESPVMKGYKRALQTVREFLEVLKEYKNNIDYEVYFYDSY